MPHDTASSPNRGHLLDNAGWWVFGVAVGAVLSIASNWMSAGPWRAEGVMASPACPNQFASSGPRVLPPDAILQAHGRAVPADDHASRVERSAVRRSSGFESRVKGCERTFGAEFLKKVRSDQ